MESYSRRAEEESESEIKEEIKEAARREEKELKNWGENRSLKMHK